MVLSGAHASAEQLARFRTEARAVGQLQHPNIVQIYEVGEHDGYPFFAMEFIAGQNLDDYLAGRPQSPKAAAALVEILARAMDYAHRQGIVHRDLKPGNVLLQTTENTEDTEKRPKTKHSSLSSVSSVASAVKITDFGLAKRLDESRGQTRTGVVMGTPSYMAPEQAEGRTREIGPATDIYALGIILYECLTGRVPFDGMTSWDTIHQVLAADPLPPSTLQPTVPRDLDTICLKCLEKAASKRYATAGALADDLHRFLNGEPVLARPIGPVVRAIKWARRRPATAALLAVSTVALIVFLVGASIFTAQLYQAKETVQLERDKAEQAVVELHVANGTRYLEDGDLFTSLIWLVKALELEKNVEQQQMNRTRIGGLLDRCPRLRQVWFHRSSVTWVTYSPDGTLVLTASDDNTAQLRDPVNGEDRGPPMVHQRSVLKAVFGAEGRLIATASADHTAAVWTAGSDKRLATLHHEKVVRDVSFNRAGTRVVTASDDETAQVWDAVSGARIGGPMKHEGAVVRASFSPDGKRVLTASADGTARLWDADTGASLLPPLKHDGPVNDARFHPDGDRVVTASDDRTARLWSADSGKQLATMQHLGAVRCAVFSAEGERILTASADMTARIWDTDTGRQRVPVMRHLSTIGVACFSPDGRFVATASDDNTARVWDAATAKALTPPLAHNGDVTQIAFSPDNRWLATASDDNSARIYGSTPRRPPLVKVRHDRAIWQASFSPDGSLILTASADHTARLWDAITGEQRAVLRHGGKVFTACFSPDGRRVLTASADTTAQVWDAATGKPLLSPPMQHQWPVRCAAFDPSGQQVVAASYKTAELWDVSASKPVSLFRLVPACNGTIVDATFSPDGSRVATADVKDHADLWVTATGKEATPSLTHERAVNRVVFSPDGKLVATASDDKTARLWDAATGAAVDAPLRQAGAIHNVSFRPDGRRLVTAGDDNTARVWDVGTGKMVLPPLWHFGAVRQAQFQQRRRAHRDGQRGRHGDHLGRINRRGADAGPDTQRLGPDDRRAVPSGRPAHPDGERGRFRLRLGVRLRRSTGERPDEPGQAPVGGFHRQNQRQPGAAGSGRPAEAVERAVEEVSEGVCRRAVGFELRYETGAEEITHQPDAPARDPSLARRVGEEVSCRRDKRERKQ